MLIQKQVISQDFQSGASHLCLDLIFKCLRVQSGVCFTSASLKKKSSFCLLVFPTSVLSKKQHKESVNEKETAISAALSSLPLSVCLRVHVFTISKTDFRINSPVYVHACVFESTCINLQEPSNDRTAQKNLRQGGM